MISTLYFGRVARRGRYLLPKTLLDDGVKIVVPAMKLPNSVAAVVDLRKLEEYSLSPHHESGGHKARVFQAALGLILHDARWLKAKVLDVARQGDAVDGTLAVREEVHNRCESGASRAHRYCTNGLDDRKWKGFPAVD